MSKLQLTQNSLLQLQIFAYVYNGYEDFILRGHM